MKKCIAILVCMLVAGSVCAELYTVGKARGLTPYRFDKNTSNEWSKMDDTLYADAELWMAYSFDDGINAYDLSTGVNDGAATNANTTPTHGAMKGGVLMEVPDFGDDS